MKKVLHTFLILIFLGQSLMVSADVDVPFMQTDHHLTEITHTSLDSLSDDDCGHCCNAHALNFVEFNQPLGLNKVMASQHDSIYRVIYTNPQESPFIKPPIV
jgi:hypothetical protein